MNPPDDTISVRDTARRLHVHENTVRNWVKRGILASGGQVAATRVIVDVAEVTSVRRPESLESVHWFWEGQGY